MSRLIYLLHDGVQSGPFEEERVRALLASGQARPDDLAWSEGLPEWRPLSTLLPDLAPPPPPSPPPPAPPPGAPPGWSRPPAAAWTGQPIGPDGRAYSGFWRRVGASFIDGIILWFASLLVMFPFAVPLGLSRLTSDAGDPFAFLAAHFVLSLMSLGLSWIYYAFQESSSAQATLGKRALGIQVCDRQGRRISFGRATGRFLAHLLTGLTFGIGYLMCIWTARRQCLHDMLAETLVVHAPPR